MNNVQLYTQLQNILTNALEHHQIMGANILVLKNGKEVIYCQNGWADYETKTPISKDTIFRLYSLTKPITAAACMVLMERGLLDLYEPVSSFFPSYSNQMVACNENFYPPKREMLIFDLLKMTSGLVYPDTFTSAGRAVGILYQEACKRLNTKNPMTTVEFADRLATCPLSFSPGESWQYGTSADLLGAIIEKISGKKFSEFLKEVLFEPLDMKDTDFWVPACKQHRLATAYERVSSPEGTSILSPYLYSHLAIPNQMQTPPAFESGGAGLVSTLDDYNKFANMLLENGKCNGKLILKPETVHFLYNKELMPNQQPYFDKWIGLDGFTYGNLMRICVFPQRSGMLTYKNEYGWDGWLGMYFANFPDQKITILIGMQQKDSGTFSVTRKIRNVILNSIDTI